MKLATIGLATALALTSSLAFAQGGAGGGGAGGGLAAQVLEAQALEAVLAARAPEVPACPVDQLAPGALAQAARIQRRPE
jgi:hypothetical protein